MPSRSTRGTATTATEAATKLATGSGGLVYTGSFHQLGVQLLGVGAVGAFTFTTSFGALFAMDKLWGIRVEDHVETAGLDVSEHGMWGYPEFYIPVPGGYGADAHAHLGGAVLAARDGGQEQHRRVLGERRVDPVEQAHVLTVHEDVQEARDAAA